MSRGVLQIAVVLFALSVAGCTTPSQTMLVPHRDDGRPATVDPAEAVKLVNAFRAGRGLPGLALDPRLTAIAAAHAGAMARQARLAHVLPGEKSFAVRLSAGGFAADVAVENIGAGYHDLAEAFSGWRASPHHRDNMLDRRVTLMGIAVAHSADGRFGDYWSMVLAAPETPR